MIIPRIRGLGPASLALALVTATALGVRAETIGINFEGGQLNPCCGGGGTAKVTGTAGHSAAGNWNNLPNNTGTNTSLVDGTGSPSGVTITYSASNNWAATNTAPGDGANADLMSGYLDNFASGTMTVSGLGAAYTANGYDVIVYFNADSGGTQGFTLGGVTHYGRQAGGAGTNYPLAGGTNGFVLSTADAYASAPLANGILFSGLTASTFTITGAAGGGGDRARPNGIQIVGTGVAGLPAVRNDPATAVTTNTATLRGTVTEIGSAAPSVTIFYGTSDGGFSEGNWTSSVALAGTQSGGFSQGVGGLSPATVYFYRARAVNGSGTAWAASAGSFETSPEPPVVVNIAASNVEATNATVGAQVTSTGGDTPVVMIHYGTVDGGTGGWQQSVSLGNVADSATITLGGLSQNSTYFFRAFASNGGGSAWAPASGTFTTGMVMLPSVVNDTPSGITGTSATLRGDVTATGSEPPIVTVYFGISDGGTTAGAWASAVVLGARSGGFSAFVNGLDPVTSYFVRASATNSAGTVWAPSSLSFSTTALVPNTVVINEIHYDPAGVAAEEFIELINPGDSAVDISGWKLGGGVAFTFPGGTVIPAGGYRVVAADPATILANFSVTALGPFTGKLSNLGERVELRDAGLSLIDRVTYGVGFPWPTASNGGGSSMELMNPGLDNDLAGSWRASGANVAPPTPTIFMPSASTGWHYRRGTDEPSTPQAAWRQAAFVEDGTWMSAPLGTPIGYADNDDNTVITGMQNVHWSLYMRQTFNVDALDVPSTLLLRAFVDDGCVVWINGTEVARFNYPAGPTNFDTPATNHEAVWEEVILNNAGLYLIGGTNIIAVQGANSTFGSSDFSLDVELKTPDGVSLTGTPTPGAPNSVRTTRVPPHVRQVAHTPERPVGGQEVVVSARITDPDGVASAMLSYQIVEPGSYIRKTDAAYELPANWTSLPMRDDGLNGDLVVGDSTYSVIIPASVQVNRRLIRYRITVADTNGVTQRLPYEDDAQPNFAYFVYGGAPAWSGANQPGVSGNVTFPATLMDDIPIYHLIANSTDVDNSQYNSGFDGVYMHGAMVFDGKVYDHIQFKNRGEASTYQSGKNKWRFQFNTARDFQATDNWGRKYASPWDEMNFDACASPWAPVHRGMAGVEEAISYRLFDLAGIPSPKTHYVHFRVIDEAGETGGTQYVGDLWGLYLAVEHPDGSFLDDRGLPDGNVYKIEGGNGDKKHQGKTQPIDTSDWNTFRGASASTQTEAYWRANMNLFSYYTFRAGNRITGNVDVREGFNHYFYNDPVKKWTVMPWDCDMMFIAETHWSGTIQQKACLNIPVLAIEYRNRARELLDLVCSDASPAGGQIAQLIDEYAQLVNPTGQVLTWSDLDQYMWNYHPRTKGTAGNASGQGNHKGNWFATPFTDARIGGNYVRTLVSSDHEGSMTYLRNYSTNTFTGGTWVAGNGQQNGYGYEFLKSDAADTAIPARPVIAYTGTPGFPSDDLDFTTSAFADPQGAGSFSAMMWRVGEISNPSTPLYDPAKPYVYEVEEHWNSGELSAFSSTYTLPPSAVRVGHTYRARVKYKDNTGRWSNWSDPVQFVVGEPDVSPWVNDLMITEVMYHPADPTLDEINAGYTGSDFEYVELQNVGATTLDLTELRFTKGIDFGFAGGAITSLAPGGYILVVRNIAAFESRYGAGLPVAGAYAPDNLSNGGENVKLSFGLGSAIHEFTYDDEAPWPTHADGTGASMVLILPDSRPDHALAVSWRASVDAGNPGSTDATMFSGDPNGNGDGDGLSALFEYAFGTSDANGSDAGTAWTSGVRTFGASDHFAITYRRSLAADDVNLLVEKSSELDVWVTDATLVFVDEVPQGDGTSLVTWRVADPISSDERSFLRIRVTLNP
jgi:hypothetical protein